MATRRQARTDDRVRTPRLGLLTVGETARILGVSPSTLRLWENVGLISPARSNGRYRLYGRELLEVLKRIKYLRDVKRLNLPGIRQELNGGGHTQPKSAKRQPRTDDGDSARKLGPKLGNFAAATASGSSKQPGAPNLAGVPQRDRTVARESVGRHPAAARRNLWHDRAGVLRHAQACETAGPPARAAGDSARLRHPHRRAVDRRPAAGEPALDDSAGHRQRRRLLPPGRGVHFHGAGHARALARRARVSHAAAGRQFLVREHGRASLVQPVGRADGTSGSIRRRRSSRRHLYGLDCAPRSSLPADGDVHRRLCGLTGDRWPAIR